MTDLSSVATYYANNRNPFNYSKFVMTGRDQTSVITLDEARDQLNLVGDTSQDTLILYLCIAATAFVADYIGYPLQPTFYRVDYLAPVYVGNVASFDIPVQNISAGGAVGDIQFNVEYCDSSNTWTGVSAGNYFYDEGGQKLVLTEALPALSTAVSYPVRIYLTLTAPWLQDDKLIVQAAKLVLTHLYNNRSATAENPPSAIALGIYTLLRPYKPLVM